MKTEPNVRFADIVITEPRDSLEAKLSLFREAKLRLTRESCGMYDGKGSMADERIEERRMELERELREEGW